MYFAHVFHRDPMTKDYTVRRHGAASTDLQSVIRRIEKSKKEGYIVQQGSKIPVWNNVQR